MCRAAVTASVLVGFCLLTLTAQSIAPAQETQFRAGIDVVQMDVSVLDKDRRPVKGLTAADFTILENNELQPIVAFDAVDLPDIETASAAWMRDAPVDVVGNDRLSRRVVVIVFDDVLISVDRTNDVKRTAREIVNRLGPDDLGAVTFTETGRRQDLTSDHERLLKAVDSFVPHGDFKNTNEPSEACLFTGPYATKASCIIDVLVTASKALLAAPQGRKTLVYISEGFAYMPRFDHELDAHGMQQPIPVGLKPVKVPDPTAYFNTVLAMQAALTNLQRANVNVYAIDPSGVNQQGIMGPAKDWLRIFSEDTGGTATLFTNTPWEAVPTIFRENSSYYLLAFKPAPLVSDGRFHAVKVRVNRKDVEVRARSGYYARNPAVSAPAPGVASTPLDEAILHPMSGGDLAIATTVAPFAMPGQKTAALAIVTRLRDPLTAGTRTLQVVSRAMMEHYSHVRMAAKREAVEGLQTGLIEGPKTIPGTATGTVQ